MIETSIGKQKIDDSATAGTIGKEKAAGSAMAEASGGEENSGSTTAETLTGNEQQVYAMQRQEGKQNSEESK